MKYLETHYLDNEERKEYEEKGLFCYDLRHSDDGGEIACIEKNVLVNRCGSMITNEEIPLGDKYPDDYKDYEEFVKDNEMVNTIDELLSLEREKDDDKTSDKPYITFVLGYDLLNKMIRNSPSQECDINYDFCSKIAEQFISSEHYKDTSHSMYDMLIIWLKENELSIKEHYNKYIDNEDTRHRQLDNNIFIADLGYRNEQPVALVEKTTQYGKEYIIAFDYEVKNNKMSWGYAYYYDIDKNKAIKDFKKVLAGENLSDTFEKKKNKNKER